MEAKSTAHSPVKHHKPESPQTDTTSAATNTATKNCTGDCKPCCHSRVTQCHPTSPTATTENGGEMSDPAGCLFKTPVTTLSCISEGQPHPSAAFLTLFKQFLGSSSEVQLRGLTWSRFSAFLSPLAVSAGALLLLCLPPRLLPTFIRAHLFPSTTWADLAGGSPQLHRDLAAAQPHPGAARGPPAAQSDTKIKQKSSVPEKPCCCLV